MENLKSLKMASQRFGLLDIDVERVVRNQDLVYEDAATCWQDGHIMGNGDIGAICYTPMFRRVEWTINKTDVYDSRNTCTQVRRMTYKEIMGEVKKKNTRDLSFLMEREILAPAYDPEKTGEPKLKICGQLKIRSAQGEDNWAAPAPYRIRQILSLWEAKDYLELDMTCSHPRVKSFICRKENVMVVSLRQASGALVSKRLELCRPYDSGIENPVFGTEGNFIWFVQKFPDGMSYAMVAGIKRIPDQAAVSSPGTASPVPNTYQCGDRVWFNVDGDFDAFLGVATSKEVADPLVAAKALVVTAMDKGIERLELEHTTWWNDFWSKSFVQFDNAVKEQLWYFNLYETACIARKAPVPGLSGLWYGHADEPIQGLFWAIYTLNQNVQMPYLPVFAVNHPELALPFLDTFLNCLPRFIKDTASRYDGLPGACLPMEMTYTGEETAPIHLRLAAECGPFVGIIFANAFNFTRDEELLRTKVYPFLREIVRFYAAFMQKGDDGCYHLPFTVPSEVPNMTRDALEALALFKPCLKTAIQASRMLGLDVDERIKWEELLAGYPEYPTRKGIIVHGTDFGLDDFNHNVHCLYPIFPGDETDAKIIRAAKKTLETLSKGVLVSYSDKLGHWHFFTLWSWYFAAMAHLRLGDRAKVQHYWEEALRGHLKPNGMLTHCSIVQASPEESEENLRRMPRIKYSNYYPWEKNGILDMRRVQSWYSVFTTPQPRAKELTAPVSEGNGAFLMVLTEMLLQSHGNLIRVFPGTASNATARFGNLRAEGAFLVSAEIKKGRITFVSVAAEKKGIARVQNPWSGKTVSVFLSNGKCVSVNEKIVTLDLKAGETADLVVRGGKQRLKHVWAPRPLSSAVKTYKDGSEGIATD